MQVHVDPEEGGGAFGTGVGGRCEPLMLGAKPGLSGRAVYSLNFWDNAPAPIFGYFLFF